MIVHTAQEFTAYTSYDRDHVKSKHRLKESIHVMLRDDRAISIENIGKLLTTDQLDKIRHEKLFLILDFSLESSFHFVDSIYTHIIGNLNVPEKNILLVSSSHDFKDYVIAKASYFNKKPIYTEFYSFFEKLSRNFVRQFNIENDSPLLKPHKKLYINLNRLGRQHRIALLALLYNNNLLNDGYNSFVLETETDLYKVKRSWQQCLTESNNFFSKLNLLDAMPLESQLPLMLDTNDFAKNLAYTDQQPIKKFIDESLLSLVTETNFVSGTPLFLTEKIFKPIGMKHPFIVVSRPYTLKFLKSLGYKTFDMLIDESYDNEEDDSLRLLKIVAELQRLKKLSVEDIQNFKHNALPIVEHNFNVLMSKKEYLTNLI